MIYKRCSANSTVGKGAFHWHSWIWQSGGTIFHVTVILETSVWVLLLTVLGRVGLPLKNNSVSSKEIRH